MAAFLIRRVLQGIIVVLIVTMITFGLLWMIPATSRDPGSASEVRTRRLSVTPAWCITAVFRPSASAYGRNRLSDARSETERGGGA